MAGTAQHDDGVESDAFASTRAGIEGKSTHGARLGAFRFSAL
jgi:hypothetical protein